MVANHSIVIKYIIFDSTNQSVPFINNNNKNSPNTLPKYWLL